MPQDMNEMLTSSVLTKVIFRNSSRRGNLDNDRSCFSPREHNITNPMLEDFKKIIQEKYHVKINSYFDLHKWTVENCAKFWEEMWIYFGMIHSRSYDQVLVKTGDRFLDCEWFRGALFNFAENCLRIRDDRVAIVYLDEYLNEETVTYAEMFEEVKLYAAAFRKNGLKKGDTVTCYMSNRKEAVFAYFATLSIGAIWGAIIPYYGPRAASNIVKKMEPKFLIAVDSHLDDGIEYPLFDYLPTLANDVPSLERVIIVVTKTDTYKKDISHIDNSVFLEDFLEEGRIPDGVIPDIVFEQLPASHPIWINFTSGTTGLPKGLVHGAGSILATVQNSKLARGINEGDVILLSYPGGWVIWNNHMTYFASGVKIVLLCGSSYATYNGLNYWDICGKYNVNSLVMITSTVDKMEKMKLIPNSGTNLECLTRFDIAGCPLKMENISYIRTKVKKDVVILNCYGATEYGTFSGFDPSLPAHGIELQAFALGVDIQCFDKQGNSVVGERGEVVVCTPSIAFPVALWKDSDNSIMQRTYLSKYPGVWCQNDEYWINPKTKGFIIFGRSDDMIMQRGERFGCEDIYFAIHHMEELQDYICVSQYKHNGDCRAVLFVKMKSGYKFTTEIKAKIERTINDEMWEDFVPELILEVPEIPYNFNKKRMESTVRKIVQTNVIPEVPNIKNPESLYYYINIPEVVNYDDQ